MSHLNTDLVKSFGNCIPATPKPTVPAATGANKMTNGAVTPPNTNSTSTDLTNTTATDPINSTIIAMNSTFGSNGTGGVKRQRRPLTQVDMRRTSLVGRSVMTAKWKTRMKQAVRRMMNPKAFTDSSSCLTGSSVIRDYAHPKICAMPPVKGYHGQSLRFRSSHREFLQRMRLNGCEITVSTCRITSVSSPDPSPLSCD
ncbi:uncharacterized protein LOC102299694 isoform X1 [Haplochromis burtoni]|uniref:uncharacterized protein LOC102299694 isoform X1 n=1 Tax=Haplochromis burtoni TaxID=8153 RepID=UPI001C2D3AAA|nr:uncharacterized protein LOC102299694 isoform X1 [Haplochromis burtoni]